MLLCYRYCCQLLIAVFCVTVLQILLPVVDSCILCYCVTDIVASCRRLYSDALTSIIGGPAKSDPVTMVMNCIGWQRQEVVAIDTTSGSPTKKQKKSEEAVQQDSDGNMLGTVIMITERHVITIK